MKELETLKDLLDYLKKLPKDKLSQPVQGAKDPCSDSIVEMLPGIAIGTMEEMEFYGARSVSNNRFNADEVVILFDFNIHSTDGAIAHTWSPQDDYRKRRPIYGPSGKTPRSEQINPKKAKGQERTSLVKTVLARSRGWNDIVKAVSRTMGTDRASCQKSASRRKRGGK